MEWKLIEQGILRLSNCIESGQRIEHHLFLGEFMILRNLFVCGSVPLLGIAFPEGKEHGKQ